MSAPPPSRGYALPPLDAPADTVQPFPSSPEIHPAALKELPTAVGQPVAAGPS